MDFTHQQSLIIFFGRYNRIVDLKHHQKYDWLVVWLPVFIFPLILGISSSQLTNSYFSEGFNPTTNQIHLNGIFHAINTYKPTKFWGYPPWLTSRNVDFINPLQDEGLMSSLDSAEAVDCTVLLRRSSMGAAATCETHVEVEIAPLKGIFEMHLEFEISNIYYIYHH